MVFGDKITLQTKGFSDIKDITGKVNIYTLPLICPCI